MWGSEGVHVGLGYLRQFNVCIFYVKGHSGCSADCVWEIQDIDIDRLLLLYLLQFR